MVAENSRRATGYPPVTKVEERRAAENASADRAGGGTERLSADGKVMVDAIAAILDEHRRRIDTAALDAEAKQAMLDLLDGVFLDLLQLVLTEPSARELFRDSAGVGP